MILSAGRLDVIGRRLLIAVTHAFELQSRPFGEWAVASVSDTGHLCVRGVRRRAAQPVKPVSK
ncbi:hypothetical protein SRABI121_00728 [Microbacterium sp. Bi121]|nr:hypothetical protein SRABI121_00728 [Microbacterium sp. Bi121]